MFRACRRVSLAAALALAAPLALAGCGGGNESGSGTAAPRPSGAPGGNGTLVYALPVAPSSLDPLAAAGEEAQTIVVQLYEPLVETLSGPYGDLRRRRGLALRWAASDNDTVWKFRLRRRVRFSDGTPLSAGAVLANAQRWKTVPAGRRLLPDLIGADAPRPGVVRFLLSRPSRELPARLASPRLGLVSPAAMRPRSGERARLGQPVGAGPFVLTRRSDAQLDLARSPGWWGSQAGLGPALDGIRFVTVTGTGQRAGLLRDGQAQVASGLDSAAARRIQMDPLLTALPAGGDRWLGVERSVRDLRPGPESFSGVWLTRVGQR